MARVAQDFTLAGISVNPESPVAMYRQLYTGIRNAILSGQLMSGQRLPATRVLASQLKISRNTVLLAFDDLAAEGYLESNTGSGTFVSTQLPEDFLRVTLERQDNPTGLDSKLLLSKRGKRLVASPFAKGKVVPFRDGVPAFREFPFHIWSAIVARQFRKLPYTEYGYDDPAGYLPLRQAIANYLRTTRAVRCEAEQVIIVNGSQQGLDIVSRLLLDEGDEVWIEDPGYLGSRRSFVTAGAKLRPVPVDDEGMNIKIGSNKAPGARLAYVTPSHQYPIGITMSLRRRCELLKWAESENAWILEDDYDGEYRYAGSPLSSLQGLDTASRVIYMGTFSKVLFPALRIGYLVVPHSHVAAFSSAKTAMDRGSAMLEQAVLAEFISEGHFGRHIRRMRILYAERQSALIRLLRERARDSITMRPTECGMHEIAWLGDDIDDRALSDRARSAGIIVSPVSRYYLSKKPRRGLLLGYAGYDESELEQGVQKLAGMLRETVS